MTKRLMIAGGALALLAASTALTEPARAFPILMQPRSIDEMRARQTELIEASEALVAAADEAGRDLSEEEMTKIEVNKAEVERIARQIAAREAATVAGAGRATAAETTAATGADRARSGAAPGGRTVHAAPRLDQRTLGYRSLGEFAMVSRAAAMGDEGARNRISDGAKFLATIGMNEGVGEDGGNMVPPEYRDGIMKIVEGEDSLLSFCDNSTSSRNSVAQNVDKTAPWGTSGIQAYWEGEGQAAAASKAKTDLSTLRLNKLFARVDVTDELLEDAPQLDSHLRVKAPEVMTSVINLAIVQGNGVGKPLGIMNSPALVTVAKETSQPADTIHHRNLVKMMGTIYSPSWPRSRWLMHQDVWSQLPLISFRDIGSYPSVATGSAVPAYMPPSGIAGAPFGTLFGRPIHVLEAMETIGDLGDIILADMTQYRAVTKSGGMRVDTSIHLKFDTDEMVYRFIFRLAGAPWWPGTLAHRDGSNVVSPYVTLASR